MYSNLNVMYKNSEMIQLNKIEFYLYSVHKNRHYYKPDLQIPGIDLNWSLLDLKLEV